MKLLSIFAVIFSLSIADAATTMKMNFNNEELTKIIENYSKASGQKFVVDASVRGKTSIFNQEPVAIEEAFNLLSSALALQGFGISKQGDTMIVQPARNLQRNLIEVGTAMPSLKPERMYSWIYTVKNTPASKIMRDVRILTSKDGEMNLNESTNQIIFVDWASNLNRIGEIMKEIDKKADPATAKLIEEGKKDRISKKRQD
ncbi:Type II secretion system protein D precursor [compost metagenome]